MKVDSKVIEEVLDDLDIYTVGRPNDEQVHLTVGELVYQMNRLSKLIGKETSFGFEDKGKIYDYEDEMDEFLDRISRGEDTRLSDVVKENK